MFIAILCLVIAIVASTTIVLSAMSVSSANDYARQVRASDGDSE